MKKKYFTEFLPRALSQVSPEAYCAGTKSPCRPTLSVPRCQYSSMCSEPKRVLESVQSTSPELNQVLISGLSSVSRSASDKISPILCKHLTQSTPDTITTSNVEITVELTIYSTAHTQRCQTSCPSSRKLQSFVPAWRKKSMDGIQNLKCRKKGALLD